MRPRPPPQPPAGRTAASDCEQRAAGRRHPQAVPLLRRRVLWESEHAAPAADDAAKARFEGAYGAAMRKYRANDFPAAADLFRHALSVCPPTDQQLPVVYNNLAATMEKLSQPREGRRSTWRASPSASNSRRTTRGRAISG